MRNAAKDSHILSKQQDRSIGRGEIGHHFMQRSNAILVSTDGALITLELSVVRCLCLNIRSV